jgi:hypothetical protein
MNEFIVNSVIYCKETNEIDILEVWSICEEELNIIAKKSIELLSTNLNIKQKYFDLIWANQAIIEFQDLQSTLIPNAGQFIQQNYCFYECLHVLREGVLCGIGGHYHASFASFRSALELILLHLYWETKKRNEVKFDKFYNWVMNGTSKPSFSELNASAAKHFFTPKEWNLRERSKEIYALLCSYSHTPILNESTTSIKGTNAAGLSINAISYWLNLAHKVVSVILQLLISAYPMCLFPVDIINKFGFSPPIGIFFDEYNTVPLKRALGQSSWYSYRNLFEKHDNVKSYLTYFESKQTLTKKEIIHTWPTPEEPKPKDESFDEEYITKFIIMNKVHLRALMLSMTYFTRGLNVNKFTDKEITISNN